MTEGTPSFACMLVCVFMPSVFFPHLGCLLTQLNMRLEHRNMVVESVVSRRLSLDGICVFRPFDNLAISPLGIPKFHRHCSQKKMDCHNKKTGIRMLYLLQRRVLLLHGYHTDACLHNRGLKNKLWREKKFAIPRIANCQANELWGGEIVTGWFYALKIWLFPFRAMPHGVHKYRNRQTPP